MIIEDVSFVNSSHFILSRKYDRIGEKREQLLRLLVFTTAVSKANSFDSIGLQIPETSIFTYATFAGRRLILHDYAVEVKN